MSTDPLPEIEPPRPTPAEERERGRQAKSRISLGELGRVPRAVGSIDPVTILGEQAKMRIAELVPIRHQRMLGSAFGFYRGGAAIMAADLASTPDTGLWVQLCGDAHLANFGLYQTAERVQVFDINDFDETAPGPFEWDVKRLATSFEVATAVLGLEAADRQRIVVAAAREYRRQMLRFADMGHLDVWYARLDAAGAMERLSRHVTSGDVKALRHGVHKSLEHNHLTAFSKLIETTNGRTRFISQPPLLVPIEELLDETGRMRYQSVIRSFLRRVPQQPPTRPASSHRPVPVCPRRPQGGRGRQRRDSGLGGALHRARCQRPTVASAQGGAGLRARAVHLLATGWAEPGGG